MKRRFVALAAVACLAMAVASPPVTGQEGTPIPVAIGPCTRVETGPTSVATPIDTRSSGVPAETPLAEAVQRAAANVVACWNAGNWDAYVSLLNDAYLADRIGSTDRAGLVAGLAERASLGLFALIEVERLDNARLHAAGAASVELVWRHGAARKHERWFFVPAGPTWLLEATARLPVTITGQAVGFDVVVERGRLSIAQSEIVGQPTIVLHVVNRSSASIVLIVLALPPGTELGEALRGAAAGAAPALLVGEIELPPGDDDELHLVELPAGNYTLLAGERGADPFPPLTPGMAAVLSIASASLSSTAGSSRYRA